MARMATSSDPSWQIQRMYERPIDYLFHDAMVESLNLGTGLSHWSGHGNQDGIYKAEGSQAFFVSSDAAALTNGDKLGIAVSNACDQAAWDMGTADGDCFAEHLVTNPDGGMVAAIMNTREGYGAFEGGNYCVGPSERLDTTFFAGVFGNLYHTGEALAYAKATWVPWADSAERYAMQRWCIYDLNLVGDPELPIWTTEPAAATVQHNGVVALGQNVPYTVTVTDNSVPVKGAMVVLKKSDEVNLSGRTDSAGSVTLSISARTPGRMSMLVSAHNYFNHQDSVLVASARYLTHLRHEILDPAPGGNNDSILNPGESVNMPVWIKNWGNLAAVGVSVTLRSLDPAIEILDSTKLVGDIPSGDSACTAGAGFEFRVSDTCSNAHQSTLRVYCTDNMDSSWTSDFKITVGNCVLSYSGKRVHDPRPGGNNNGRLDGGDTGELFLTLRNTGEGHGYNIRAVLRSRDPLFQVLDSVSTWARICCDTTGENPADSFVVHVDASVAPETEFPCTLLLSGDNYYRAVLPVTVLVGELRGVDPIHDNKTPALYWAIDNVDEGYAGRPDYDWIEIRGRGFRLGLSDDETVPVDLPAAFGPIRFYYQPYPCISVCSNGWIAPGLSYVSSPFNSALPIGGLPNAIFANWDDLDPTRGGSIWVYHDAARHAFIVEWDSVAYKNDSLGADKFEIVIFDTTLAAPDGNSEILVQYMTANGLRSSTAGIQDPSRTFSINCLFDNAYNRGTATIRPRSAIKYTTAIASAEVSEPRPVATPTRLGIYAARNPFRGTARVQFSLPAAAPVRIGVYDTDGRLVRTLLDRGEALKPGSYTLTWNGRDAAQRSVASGIYFYRLETPQGTVACKAIKLD
jgi:hypothetical protein